MKKSIVLLLLGIIILLALLLGLTLSGQKGTDSIRMTDNLLVKTNILTSEEVQSKSGNYTNYSYTIRKLGHFSLYALAAGFIFLWIYIITGSVIVAVLGSLCLVFAYASFDEYRQKSVEGRTFNKLDIMIDMLGACIAVFNTSLGVVLGRLKRR